MNRGDETYFLVDPTDVAAGEAEVRSFVLNFVSGAKVGAKCAGLLRR